MTLWSTPEERLRVPEEELKRLGYALESSQKKVTTIEDSTTWKQLVAETSKWKKAETLSAAKRENTTLRGCIFSGSIVTVIGRAVLALTKCLDTQLESLNWRVAQCYGSGLTAVELRAEQLKDGLDVGVQDCAR